MSYDIIGEMAGQSGRDIKTNHIMREHVFVSPRKLGRHIGTVSPAGLLVVAMRSHTYAFRSISSIAFKVCRRVNHCKLQVKFHFGDHWQNFDLSYWPF